MGYKLLTLRGVVHYQPTITMQIPEGKQALSDHNIVERRQRTNPAGISTFWITSFAAFYFCSGF